MPESYFELPVGGQREILDYAFNETGRSPSVIEKDIWLTLVLQLLFDMPGRKAMAFKGGTSLSKAFGVINRFSEDVDITVDFRDLGCQHRIPELLELSGGQRRKVSDSLKAEVGVYIREVILPYLNSQIQNHGCASECELTVSEDGESIHVSYPARATEPDSYMRDHVLVEFGGRNIIDPNAVHSIQPDIAELIQGVAFPRAGQVVVLSAARTFWEKVTLIHAQCNRPIAEGKDRISRHWYDLAMLLQHEVGQQAKSDLQLLADVVDLKSVFYNSATAHYARCLSGELNLIPERENFTRLQEDYIAMEHSGMLNGHVYSLGRIMEDLTALQEHVNHLAQGWR
ncbi:MAG: nucleotidyl transferase AbiEii/AbiGii toxin family protein [Pseudomonas sp.]